MKEIYGIKKVTKKDGSEESYWTRIGIAHENKDGSLNCYLDYLPVGQGIAINIRDKKEKKENGNEKENVDF